MKIGRQFQKMILCIAAVIILFGMSCIGVKADDSLILGMDQYRTENGKIILYVNHNKGSDFNLDTADSSVVVGKQTLPIENVIKFKDSGEPVSYMFVVDISGSMSKDRIDTIKDTLRQFIGMTKAGDNICIATMADELISSGFTDDGQALNGFIDGIAITKQDTDLYTSIKEELNTLKTDKNVHRKRCLVIFSDGADDQKGGITQSEAETQVKESHIPIFTVALLPSKYRDSDIESAKILGSFARYSAGGQHYVPQVDGFECNEVCGKIIQSLEDSLIISADLADVTAQDGNIYLGVEFSDGATKAKDGMQIPVGDILAAIKEAQSAKAAANAATEKKETPKPEQPVETPKKLSTMTYVLIGCIAAVILITVVIIILVSGKKKEQPPASVPVGGGGNKTIGLGQSAPSVPVVEKTPSSGVKVTLYKMGPGGDESYPLVLDTKKSLGRKKSCDLSFENDNALSGIHCYIFSKGKKVYVQDNKSTNGTFVNGVPITGEFIVETGDILLAGSAEYKIVQM